MESYLRKMVQQYHKVMNEKHDKNFYSIRQQAYLDALCFSLQCFMNALEPEHRQEARTVLIKLDAELMM